MKQNEHQKKYAALIDQLLLDDVQEDEFTVDQFAADLKISVEAARRRLDRHATAWGMTSRTANIDGKPKRVYKFT